MLGLSRRGLQTRAILHARFFSNVGGTRDFKELMKDDPNHPPTARAVLRPSTVWRKHKIYAPEPPPKTYTDPLGNLRVPVRPWYGTNNQRYKVPKHLRKANASFQRKWIKAKTPLMTSEKLRDYFEKGIKIDQEIDVPLRPPETDNGTAIHYAAHFGHVDVLEALIDLGGNVDEPSSFGTPLHRAYQANQFDAYRLLLERGATKLESEDVALQSEDPKVRHQWKYRERLRGKPPDPTLHTDTEYEYQRALAESNLIRRSREGTMTAISVRNMKKEHANLNVHDFSKATQRRSLMRAIVEKNDAVLLAEALSMRASADTFGLLQWAAEAGAADCLSMLLDAQQAHRLQTSEQCDAKRKMPMPLTYAARAGSLECMQLLQDKRASLWSLEKSFRYPQDLPAYAALATENDSIYAHVVKNNEVGWVNAKLSPLFLAARVGELEWAERLMRHGADINYVDAEGQTPLHGALLLEKQYSHPDYSDKADTISDAHAAHCQEMHKKIAELVTLLTGDQNVDEIRATMAKDDFVEPRARYAQDWEKPLFSDPILL